MSFVKSIDVAEYAKNNGCTLEEAGRMVRYAFFDEVGEKLNNSDVIEETYRKEKLAIINELLPLFQTHLEMVSVPFTK